MSSVVFFIHHTNINIQIAILGMRGWEKKTRFRRNKLTRPAVGYGDAKPALAIRRRRVRCLPLFVCGRDRNTRDWDRGAADQNRIADRKHFDDGGKVLIRLVPHHRS